MSDTVPIQAKRTRLPRHRFRATVIVDDRLPQATAVRWNGKTAECIVRPDADDEALGMLFRTLAIDAGATVLDAS